MSDYTYTISYWPADEDAAKSPPLDFAAIKKQADTTHYMGVRVEEPPIGFLSTLKSATSPAHAALRDVLPSAAKAGLKTITVTYTSDPSETLSGKLVEHAFLYAQEGFDKAAIVEWSKGGAEALKAAGAEVCNAATYGDILEDPEAVILLIGWESFPAHRAWTAEGGPGRALLLDLFAKIDRGRLFAAHVPYSKY
ncbi:hypothetical protein PENSPDRAFT_687175 [Peniophora sp. CONT]|nr:hypothetical protein PENSPDRAFT_687175 [Peniophora sp. CONT]